MGKGAASPGAGRIPKRSPAKEWHVPEANSCLDPRTTWSRWRLAGAAVALLLTGLTLALIADHHSAKRNLHAAAPPGVTGRPSPAAPHKHPKKVRRKAADAPAVAIPPWAVERLDAKDRLKNDSRTPIRPPIREGYPAECDDEPDEALVLRRGLPPLPAGLPFCEIHREIVHFESKKVGDKIDPPRFFPLVGPARLHHLHYECRVTLAVTLRVTGLPGAEWKWRCEQVVPLDSDHLHLEPTWVAASTSDRTGGP
jgi:hypothetical protein